MPGMPYVPFCSAVISGVRLSLLDKRWYCRHMIAASTIIALFSYTLAAALQGLSRSRKFWVLLLGVMAVGFHAELLHVWIDGTGKQNLSYLNLFSLSMWLSAILVIIVASFRRVELLTLMVFPLCALSIILVLLFPSYYGVETLAEPMMLFHIILSILCYGIFCVIGMLALLLIFQERLLRIKKILLLIQKFPPLQSLEILLFQMIKIGFILLSLVLITSFYFYHDRMWHNSFVLRQAILATMAWLIFGVLLLGRQRAGWRGRRAIYTTLLGVALLTLL